MKNEQAWTKNLALIRWFHSQALHANTQTDALAILMKLSNILAENDFKALKAAYFKHACGAGSDDLAAIVDRLLKAEEVAANL